MNQRVLFEDVLEGNLDLPAADRWIRLSEAGFLERTQQRWFGN